MGAGDPNISASCGEGFKRCLSPLQKGSVCLFLRHCVLLDFLHGRLFKLVALSNLLGVHGLFRSFVVAFLAVAVRSNSGLRTAILRMLVFHRSTSALPVHWWPPARCGFYTRLLLKNDLLSSPRMIPAVGEARENAALWTSGGAPTRVPK